MAAPTSVGPAGCIRAASCDCGVCSKCKARIERRYQRARNKGPAAAATKQRKYRGFCDCGKCFVCTERARVRAYNQKKREAKANGVPMEPSARQQKADQTRERKELIRQQWAELARRRRENPLSEKQREEVRSMIREQMEVFFDLD